MKRKSPKNPSIFMALKGTNNYPMAARPLPKKNLFLYIYTFIPWDNHW
jgi:hypothetical protein